MATAKDIYDSNYKKTHYEQIAFRVKKGKREEYQLAAQDFGLTLSELLKISIEIYIADRSLHDLPVKPVKPAPISKPESPKLSTEERRLLDEFNKLPPDVQKSIAKMIHAINAELDRDKIIACK